MNHQPVAARTNPIPPLSRPMNAADQQPEDSSDEGKRAAETECL